MAILVGKTDPSHFGMPFQFRDCINQSGSPLFRGAWVICSYESLRLKSAIQSQGRPDQPHFLVRVTNALRACFSVMPFPEAIWLFA